MGLAGEMLRCDEKASHRSMRVLGNTVHSDLDAELRSSFCPLFSVPSKIVGHHSTPAEVGTPALPEQSGRSVIQSNVMICVVVCKRGYVNSNGLDKGVPSTRGQSPPPISRKYHWS